MAPKLLSARASIRSALQQPAGDKFSAANNPDSVKFGKTQPKKKKKSGPSISLALIGSF